MRATCLIVVGGVVLATIAGCGSGGSGSDQAGSGGGGADAAKPRRTRPPATPAGLTATVSGGTVLLAWSPSATATGYDVYRATSSTGAYARLTASRQAQTTYADGAAMPGSTYWYEVVASNAAGSSSPTAPVSAAFPAAAQTVAVTVSPGAAAVDGCSTLQLSAAVTGTATTGVAWSVQEGAGGGTVSGTGLYTAPSTAGTYHVIAASSAVPSAEGTVTVTVQDHILAVSLNPATTDVGTGGSSQFTATVTTTCGSFAAQ